MKIHLNQTTKPNSYLRHAALIVGLLFTDMCHASKLRIHGQAQVARSVVNTKLTVTGLSQAGLNNITPIITDLTTTSALGTDTNKASGPGSIYIDVADEYQVKLVASNNLATASNAIPGTKILVLAKDADANNHINAAGPENGAFTAFRVATAEGSLAPTAIQILNANNGAIAISDLDTPATPTTSTIMPTGTILPTPQENTMAANGEIKIKLASNLTFFSNNASFRTLSAANQAKRFFILSSVTDLDDATNGAPLYRIADADLGTASNYTEYDTLSYLAVSLGGGADFDISPILSFSANIGLEAPIEAIEHQSIYFEINPEISVLADVGLKVGNDKNKFGLHTGARFTRYNTTYQSQSGTGTTATLSSQNGTADVTQGYAALNMSTALSPMVQGYIEYMTVNTNNDLKIAGTTNTASLNGQRISIGVATAFYLGENGV